MLNIIIGAVIAVAVIAALIAAFRLSQSSRLNLSLMPVGAFMGLILGALLSVPIGKLPAPYGRVLPIIVTFIITLLAMALAVSARAIVAKAWPQWRSGSSRLAAVSSMPGIVVDTSVIIDGRIADIAKAGFVPGRLLIPRFVLAELQNIADSSDAMRRGRGRRGLEVLNVLQAHEHVEVEVVDHEIPDIKEVDAKLVRLAKNLSAHILTTDFNLNRVAQIEGVRVLNVNELSNAVRPVVLPGEKMIVRVVQAGKEKGQGVGYLPDGTMIVVDKGDKLIGQDVATEITRVFQTVAGKMLFAAPIAQSAESQHPVRHAVATPVDPSAPSRSASPRRGYNNHRQAGRPKLLSQPTPNPMPSSTPAAPVGATASPRPTSRPAGKSQRRVSPMQRLEDSLIEMNGDASSRK